MSLHVHCHISGGHVLPDIFSPPPLFIFSTELPVALRAFIHGDGNLLNQYLELQEVLVCIYFHSNIEEFNKVQCWAPLKVAGMHKSGESTHKWVLPEPCQVDCKCCFPRGMGPIPQRQPEEDRDCGFGLNSTANPAD